jgi:hypothetical protein
MPDTVRGVFGHDIDRMPLTVLQRVTRVISDGVLIPKFVRDFVEGVRDLAAPAVVGDQLGPATADRAKALQNIHVQ